MGVQFIVPQDIGLRPDLADRVSGREDVTFADLVRLVVPGTAGNETIDVREIGSEVVEDLEPESMAALRLTAPLTIRIQT